MLAVVDYSEHFWGEKHHGYHVLYENLKHEEDSVQELAQFLKERASFEEETTKYYSKCIARTSALSSSGGIFSSAWLVTKNTMEILAEIQASLLAALQQLLKDVIKFHDELVRLRKRSKEHDVVDAVNLMQTTTTCLQKSKETYAQRAAELERLKKDNATAKEIAKAENKLSKSRDEYKSYVEKYGRVRDDFEEKMIKATRTFQARDCTYLQQMRAFLASFAITLDDSTVAASQVTVQYRASLEKLNIEEIMLKYVEARGTGKDRPEFAVFEELDAIGDSGNVGINSAPSSSNSSAVISSAQPQAAPTERDLLRLDTTNAWNENNQAKIQPSPVASDSSSSTAPNAPAPTVPFSASLGRQKLSLWLPGKRKKYASQSSLPAPEVPHTEFSHSQSESFGFLKKYRKHKKSNLDLTAVPAEAPMFDDARSTASSSKSDEKTCPGGNGIVNETDQSLPSERPPLPAAPPPDDTEDGDSDHKNRVPHFSSRSRWSSCTDSSDDEEMRQAAKLRQLNIKPLNESRASVNASVDELRDAIGSIVLNASMSRSSTFDCDPWSATNRAAPFSASFGGSVRPLRAALTGDEHLRRKRFDSYNAASLPFSLSMSGTGIARARPHSSTPTPGTSCLTLPTSDACITRLDSIGSEQAFSRCGSISSLERTDLPFSISTTNILSATINENSISVAMAVNEYVHAWFKGSDLSRVALRVFGTVLVSFPAATVPMLTDLSTDIGLLNFTVANADKIKTILPNKQLLSEVVDAFTAPHTFVFQRESLAEWLTAQKAEKSDADFYHTEILRYELKDPAEPPLIVTAYWKLETENTDIRIDYRLNTASALKNTLINVIFATKVEGAVVNVIADPKAEWSPVNNTISWKLTELSLHGDCSGSLKARLTLLKGPTAAAQTFVQFQASDASISGAKIVLTGDDIYHLSMVRRKVFAGKYFCDPEVRS